ncbi:MAG: hypothetical protein J7M14_03825 [Planctomycetes bacterium]|nr:hypothetical protein [Planctomycetota bacterium]
MPVFKSAPGQAPAWRELDYFEIMRLIPGDCVLTGMGHHHDFPVIHEPYNCAYFETTMEGRKRPGHLWNHTHGPAEPQSHRV